MNSPKQQPNSSLEEILVAYRFGFTECIDALKAYEKEGNSHQAAEFLTSLIDDKEFNIQALKFLTKEIPE